MIVLSWLIVLIKTKLNVHLAWPTKRLELSHCVWVSEPLLLERKIMRKKEGKKLCNKQCFIFCGSGDTYNTYEMWQFNIFSSTTCKFHDICISVSQEKKKKTQQKTYVFLVRSFHIAMAKHKQLYMGALLWMRYLQHETWLITNRV